MILYTFIAIDCIAYAIYGMFLISLFANVKHNDKKPVIICFIYFLLDNIFSWMDTIINAKVFFEKAVFSNLEILIELIFILWLFFRFKKDSPFLGYVIFYIYSLLNLVFIGIFSILRKLLLPQVSGLATAHQWNDYPSLLVFIFGYACTFIIAKKINTKFTALLNNIPNKILTAILLIFVALDLFPPLFISFTAKTDHSHYYITTSYLMLWTYFVTAVLVLIIFIFKYKEELLFRRLLNIEMQSIHSYYTLMIQLHTQIKHLRHDIVNYSNIISTTSKDSSRYLQLRNDILSITSELRKKINVMLPPPSLQINAFSAYENYVLWSSVNEILTFYNIEFKELNTIHTQENGKEYLTLHFPDINNKLNRIVKQSYNIQMIDFLAKNHNGSADFKKEETWILRISI